jgi:hypothetical protein
MSIAQIPITCLWQELDDSGSGTINFSAPSFEKKWATYGWGNESDAVAYAKTRIPTSITVSGIQLFFNEYKIEPASEDGLLWIVTATYKFQIAFTEMSFDTSGNTGKIQQALDVGDYYNCDGTGDPEDLTPEGQGVPSFNGLIGVNGDSVEGCEVTLPDRFDFTILTRLALASMPSTYIDALSRITGMANNAPLSLTYNGQTFTFDTEELLFLGVPGKQNSTADMEFTLKFSTSRGKAGGIVITVNFSQPLPGGTADVTVASTSLFTAGQNIYLLSNGSISGGVYNIASIISDTQMAITNISGGTATGVLPAGSYISADQNDNQVLVIGQSGPIAKRGWRYLWTNSKPMPVGGALVGGRLVGVQRVMQPNVAVVNKVIYTADFSIIGIFN